MHPTTAFALLAALSHPALAIPVSSSASAADAASAASSPAIRFRARTSNPSNAVLHDQPISAHSSYLAVRPDATTGCPGAVVPHCASYGNATVLALDPGTAGAHLGLAAAVPGGQHVYVDPAGALRYTLAHSGHVVEGAVASGFAYDAAARELRFQGKAAGGWADGFVVCERQEGWLLFVKTDVVGENCVSVGIATVDAPAEAAAWQYT